MVQLADANSPMPTHRRIKSSRRRRVGPQSNTTYLKLNIQKSKRYLVKKTLVNIGEHQTEA